MNEDIKSANDKIYCRLCCDTGRVCELDEDLQPTIDPCVLCHPEKLGFDEDNDNARQRSAQFQLLTASDATPAHLDDALACLAIPDVRYG